MKISYHWIKELVPELTHSPEQVAELLTMHSFEVEIERVINVDPKIKVVRIEKIKPHPNADRLQLVSVTDNNEQMTVVCGASNIKEGDSVPYAPVGARVQDEHGKQWTIKEISIRGQESAGMLTSARELGLGNWSSGILQLPLDTPLGSSLSEHMPTDTILTADITPNRGHDCLSHLGIAREVAGLLGLPVVEPAVAKLPEANNEWTITIQNTPDTPRYIGLYATNITNNDSPLWMQARLFAVGARPISLLVDITNYLMFEQGTPTHAFDAKQLSGNDIGVRRAAAERLVALDGQEYIVSDQALVITNNDKPVAIAGIIGGAASEVTPATTEAFLEIANFNAFVIQQASAALRLNTEGAMRWSKGVDVHSAGKVAARALQLVRDLTQATVTLVADTNPEPDPRLAITFDSTAPARIAGAPITSQQCQDALLAVRCHLVANGKHWQVTPPTDRLDITGPHDLVEEVIRIVGYEHIPSTKPATDKISSLPPLVQTKETMRNLLVELGFIETMNYSFEVSLEKLTFPTIKDDSITVTNPVSPEQKNLRQTLIPGLMRTVATNKDAFTQQNIFEVGHVFKAGPGGRVPGVIEQEYLAGISLGAHVEPSTIRSIIEEIARAFDVSPDQEEIFLLHEILPETEQKRLKINQPVAVFEINLEQLTQHAEHIPAYEFEEYKDTIQYQAISKYPPSFRDISLIVAPHTRIEDIEYLIAITGKELVQDVDLFDVFESKQGRSMAFRIKYQSNTKTLDDDQVNAVHNTIVSALKKQLYAQLR